MAGRFALVLAACAAATVAPAVASASPFIPGVDPDVAGLPVPLNGEYSVTTALDRQTFNGYPNPAIPFASSVRFNTSCTTLGCFAHSSMSARGVPFDFRWTGTEWESVQRIDWTCEGHTAPAKITITLTPRVDGTLSGTRSADVAAPGCGTPRVPGVVTAPLSAVPA